MIPQPNFPKGILKINSSIRYRQRSDSWCSTAALTPGGRVWGLGGFISISDMALTLSLESTDDALDSMKGLRIWESQSVPGTLTAGNVEVWETKHQTIYRFENRTRTAIGFKSLSNDGILDQLF
jgi:hypothetical protein